MNKTKIYNKDIFDRLYQNVDGMRISFDARSKLSYHYVGHTYGEATFDGFSKIIESLGKDKRGIFYDLGSGTGKPVFIASLMGFKTSIGVEEMRDLHDAAQGILDEYRSKFKKNLSPDKKIEFICSDFADVDFSNGDVIFLNATCLEYEFTPSLINKFESLKKGAKILTTSIALSLPSYKVQSLGYFPFSWDNVEVFLHSSSSGSGGKFSSPLGSFT